MADIAPQGPPFSAAALDRLRQAAAGGDPAWLALAARLDADLARPLTDWQGFGWPRAWDYTVGYLATGDRRYFGKAVGLVRTLHSYPKDRWDGCEVAGIGDDAQVRFSLRAGALSGPDNVLGRLSPRYTQVVTRGAGDTDTIDYYSTVWRVWDDSGDYAAGVDWERSPDDRNNTLRWLPGGRRPAEGMAYSVRLSNYQNGQPFHLPVVDGAIAFIEPPVADTAVYVQYCYSTSGDLPYQETVGDNGGFNLVFVDDSYPTRNAAWLWLSLLYLTDDPAFPADLRAWADGVAVRVADYCRRDAYLARSLQSNYGTGHEFCRATAAVYLARSGHPEGPRVLAELLADRAEMLGQLSGPAPSLAGCYWPEGWGYGELALANLVSSGLLLEAAGYIDATPERDLATAAIYHLTHATPDDGATVYNGGDTYADPLPFPHGLMPVLGNATRDPAARALARRLAVDDVGFDPLAHLLYPDFWASAPATRAERDALPLDHYAAGTGLVLARTGWGPDDLLISFLAGPLLDATTRTTRPATRKSGRAGRHSCPAGSPGRGPTTPSTRPATPT
jgi:hypothetical protein